MANKAKKKAVKKDNKTKKILIIIAVIIGIITIAIISLNKNGWKNAKKVEDIKINKSDSIEIKTQKLKKQKELVDSDLNNIQQKIDKELEVLSILYEEQKDFMKEYQKVEPATADDVSKADENMQDYLKKQK